MFLQIVSKHDKIIHCSIFFLSLDIKRQDSYMKTLITIGSKIRALREKSEMPLRRLASLLDIDQSTLSKIERDERKASLSIIENVANIFNFDKSELLIIYFSDLISCEIEKENNYIDILKIARKKIEYKRSLKITSVK